MPNIIARNNYAPNPSYIMGDRGGKGSYCFSNMENK
jgi:hypothetical protein